MNSARYPLTATTTTRPPCIGIFDSGVGGLSILRALHPRVPAASMVYVGDVAHAPYGGRPATAVVARCMRIVEWLAEQRARLIVVACNTATVHAIGALRSHWPELVFVGVEPGVKPAAAQTRTGRIAVMATPATAASQRLRHLIAHHADGAQVHIQPCPELASAIEHGALVGPALLEVLRPTCDQILAASVDTVVLGCTHYAFVAESIQSLLGTGITLIDTAAAVAERTASVWEQVRPAQLGTSSTVRVFSTGAAETMRLLLQRCPGLEHVEVERLTL